MDNASAKHCLAELETCRSLIRRLTPRTFDPEDIYQDVCIAAMRQEVSGDGAFLPLAWLRIVARNTAVRRHRRETIRQHSTLSADPVNYDAAQPIVRLERIEGQAMVREAVESLKPKYRDVIERRFFADESVTEIASGLGIPEQTVRTRYKRAIKQLKAMPDLAELA